MANMTTALDILADALQKAGELQSSASPYYSLGQTYLNNVYREVTAGTSTFLPDFSEPFVWAKAQVPGTLVLKAPYETGTVTLTAGSTAGVFSDAPAYSVTGYYVRITDRAEFFRIVSHVAASTAFVIDTAYTDATVTSSFQAHKLDYALTPGIARLIEPMRVDRTQSYEGDNEGMIYGCDPVSFAKDYPRWSLLRGVPVRFTVIGEADGQYTVRMNKSAETDTRVEYEYVPVSEKLMITPFAATDVDATANTITLTNHGLAANAVVQLTGTLPGGLTANTSYFVIVTSANVIQLAAVANGTAIDLTTTGGAAYLASVPVFPREDRLFLAYATAYWIMTDKSDSRADAYFRHAQAKLQSMVSERKKAFARAGSKDFGRLVPRQEQLMLKQIRSASGLRY